MDDARLGNRYGNKLYNPQTRPAATCFLPRQSRITCVEWTKPYMAPYGILDQVEEDALHAARLLNVEEKLFKRLSKRLLAPDSFLNSPRGRPEDAATENSDTVDTTLDPVEDATSLQKLEEQRTRWRDDALLDFASYESNILRTQFLLGSNEQERQRYAAEKERILETAQRVRENNIQLQAQLDEAQKTLALRKTYDDQATKIVDDPTLKSRDEQQLNIQKLQEEIAELERESDDYANTWVERREQFNKIFDAGEDLLRLIRDEKEEAERKEGMDEIDPVEGGTPRAYTSGAGTPKASGDATPVLGRDEEQVDSLAATTSSKLSQPVSAEDDSKMEDEAEIEEGEEQETEVMDTTS